jgi:carboxylesterase type B
VISSRVSDEGSTFIGNQPVTDSSFELLVDSQVGNSTFTKDLKARAQRLYPSTKHIDSPYQSETLRISDYVTESSFTCHNRLVADAYAGKVYTVEYAVSKAKHGADQSATFFNPLKPENRNIAPDMLPNKLAYQSYFTSFARTGNPNTYRNNATIEWPLTTGFDGVTLKNVLRFEQPIGAKGFRLEEDTGETRVHCQFWTDVQKAIQESLVHVN